MEMLLPLQKLQIKDVVLDKAKDSGPEKQVMAIFDQEGKPYAFQIGTAQGSDFRIFADGMLFLEDPHELYQHWPPDVWEAIAKHEVQPGMSEIQVIFSVGVGLAQSSYDLTTLRYPNGGNPLIVTYDASQRVTSVKSAEKSGVDQPH